MIFFVVIKAQIRSIKSPLSRGDLGVCAVVKYLQSVGWMKDRLEKSPLSRGDLGVCDTIFQQWHLLLIVF